MSSPPAAESRADAPGVLAVPITGGRKLGYGIGNVAYSLPYQLSASLFMLFATAILRIPAAIAGTVGALSIVWDAVTDPVVGYLSDHTESRRFGRRHLYILLGGIGIAAANALLWTIPSGAGLGVRVTLT